jgi:hypothetical protein
MLKLVFYSIIAKLKHGAKLNLFCPAAVLVRLHRLAKSKIEWLNQQVTQSHQLIIMPVTLTV